MSNLQRQLFLVRAPLALAAAGALALAGCGGEGSGSGAPTPASTTANASPSASPTPSASPSKTPDSRPLSATSDDPQKVAISLKSQIAQIGKIVKITEDNDANNLIGRPGQYDAATFMQDTRLPCTAKDQYDELSIDCGAKIERWASNKDAHSPCGRHPAEAEGLRAGR